MKSPTLQRSHYVATSQRPQVVAVVMKSDDGIVSVFSWSTLYLFLAWIVAAVALTGCETSGSGEHADHEIIAHKPTNFVDAAKRLEALHEELLSEPLEAREADPYESEQTHSHDHDEEHEHGHNHSHGHDHSHEKVVKVIDAWQEMSDLVQWLPSLAADSDLDEKEWTEITELSAKLQELMQNSRKNNAASRQAYFREHADRFAEAIDRIVDIGATYSQRSQI